MLFVARISAKLNLFFGVANINTEFLPSTLSPSAQPFPPPPDERLLPRLGHGPLLRGRLLDGTPRRAPPRRARRWAIALLAVLTLLALLEHWFMVLPLPDQKLWRWMIDPPAPKPKAPLPAGLKETPMDFDALFTEQLDALKAEGNYRIYANLQRQCGAQTRAVNHRGEPRDVTVWCSNDYLGMAQHPTVVTAMVDAVQACGTGAGGTRNISGNAVTTWRSRPSWPTCTARKRRCCSPRAMSRTGRRSRPSARAFRTPSSCPTRATTPA